MALTDLDDRAQRLDLVAQFLRRLMDCRERESARYDGGLRETC